MSLIDLTTDIVSKLSPALLKLDGTVYLAWTDKNSEVNLSWYRDDGPVASPIGQKSKAGPSLTFDRDGRIVIGWSGYTEKRIHLTTTADGISFTTKEINETTPYTPALANYDGQVYIAFTGDSGKIYVKRYPDGRTIPVGEKGASSPAIAAYGKKLCVVWRRSEGTCWSVNSVDGNTFTKPVELKWISSSSAPTLAATSEGFRILWTDANNNVYIRALDEPTPTQQIQPASSRVAPAAVGSEDHVYVAWTQTDTKIGFYNFGESRPSRDARAISSGGDEYISAQRHLWGFQIDLSHQAATDVLNATGILDSIAEVVGFAGANVPTARSIAAMISGLAAAGALGIGFLDRGNGVSLKVPWTSLVPILPPLGPGGIVVPVPR